jgi:phosphoglycolate phosphatase-like HAD superfamily hydrolase
LGDVFIVSPRSAAREKAAILADRAIELYIGDTESDMHAAQQAGSGFVAVSCGQRSPEYLASRCACFVAPSLAQAVLAIA